MLLALAEVEPASSEVGAAARAYLAQHPVARPSLVASTRSARDVEPPPRQRIKGIAFIDDDRLVAGYTREMRVHATPDLATRTRIKTPLLRDDPDRVAVVVSPDGRHVATWAGDELVVRDTGSMTETWRFATTVETSADDYDDPYAEDDYEDRSLRAVVFVGPHLAFATAHEKVIHIVRTDGTPVASLAGHHSAPDALHVAANGTLVSCSWSDVIVWKLDGSTATIAHRQSIHGIIADGVAATALSPDAKSFALEGTEGFVNTDLATGEATRKVRERGSNGSALVFTPDGRSVVGLVGDELRIRDASTGEVRASFSGIEAFELRMLPDGTRVLVWACESLSGGTDTLSLFDVATGHELARWITAAPIHDVAVSPSGDLIAIATTAAGSLELIRWHEGPPALVVRSPAPKEDDYEEDDFEEDGADDSDTMPAPDLEGLPSAPVERIHALLARASEVRRREEPAYLSAAASILEELRGSLPADRYAQLQHAVGLPLVRTDANEQKEVGIAMLLEAIEADNLDAMFDVGLELARGVSLAFKPDVGRELMERAAERDHPRALHFVAIQYIQDPAKKLAMVTRAAELGVPWSRTRLADWALQGTFGPPDPERAFALYTQVADREERAAAGLAILYKHGLGVAKDAELAKHWYDRAAKAAHDWSADDRWSAPPPSASSPAARSGAHDGCLDETDNEGLPTEPVARIHALLARAPEAEPLEAESFLLEAAAIVETLRGRVPADLHAELKRMIGIALLKLDDAKLAKKGVKLLREAIDAGDLEALFLLGIELVHGDRVKAKPKEGLALIERAAESEHPKALHFTGMDYFENPSKRDRALAMVTRAAALGVPWSRVQLADWAVEGTFGPKDPERAFALYMEVADQDEGAAAGLAILYKYGLGVPKDAKLAKQWHDRAKAAGHDWDDDERW